MTNFNLKSIIADIKNSYSAFDFAKYSLNLPISRPGQAICAPDFIRKGDSNPSFTVYDSIAIDFASNSRYDIIDLAALALFNGNKAQAIEYLHGSPIWTNPSDKHSYSSSLANASEEFQKNIAQYHQCLITRHPEVVSYLHARRITDKTINDLQLGYHEGFDRLIFPYWKNGLYVYWNGRDMKNRHTLPKNSPNYRPKYLKCRLDYSPVCENIIWGNQSIKPKWERRHVTFTNNADEVIDTGRIDPKDTTLVIVEGQVDAVVFFQEGWQVQSPGTTGFSFGQKKEIIDMCRSFDKVFICLDNDAAGSKGQTDLAYSFMNAGINFVCGHVPEVFDGHKCKDVSDYYTAGGDLDLLVEYATPGLIELASKIDSVKEFAAFLKTCARHYDTAALYELREACYEVTSFPKKLIRELYAEALKPALESDVAKIVDDKHTLLFDDSGVFYEYKRGVWEEISEYIVHRYAGEALGRRASSVRMRSVTNYLKDIHAGRYVFNSKPVFVFTNGTLHLDEQDPDKAFTASRPSDMSTMSVPYPFSWEARREKWDKFISDITGGDEENIRLLKQIGGYVLVGDNRFQKIFCLLGDGSNGKSVFMNTLEQVFGPDNCSSVQPSSLGGQFDPIALKDSLVNFCYEMQNLKDGSAEILKAVASGDAITAAHKGVDAVRFKTRAKFIVAANKMFNANDVSYGFIRRLVFVKFDRQFLGRSANKNLGSELLAELPGIFLWCYEGYRDLLKNGGFIDTLVQAEALQDFYEQVSTVRFATEQFSEVTTPLVRERDMYAAYKEWCESGGFRKLNRVDFMKDMQLITRTKFRNIKIRRNPEGVGQVFIFPGNAEVSDLESYSDEARALIEEAVASTAGNRPAQIIAGGSSAQTQETQERPADEGTVRPQKRLDGHSYQQALREVIEADERLIGGLDSGEHAEVPGAALSGIASFRNCNSAHENIIIDKDAPSSCEKLDARSGGVNAPGFQLPNRTEFMKLRERYTAAKKKYRLGLLSSLTREDFVLIEQFIESGWEKERWSEYGGYENFVETYKRWEYRQGGDRN